MYDKPFSKMCIDKHINEIEKEIEDTSFEIIYEGLAESMLDKDNILGEVFQKILFSISGFRINEILMYYPLTSENSHREQQAYIDKMLKESVTRENVCGRHR